MSWDIELVTILRYMVADTGTGSPPGEPPNYVYSDNSLQTLILAALRLIQIEILNLATYTVNVSGMLLSPDPTEAATKDDGAVALILTKAACIIDNSEARLAAKRAVIMRDANKLVDLTEVSKAKIAIWEKGWCQNYQDIKFEYALGNSYAGMAVIGPFRLEMNWMPGPWLPDGNSIGYNYIDNNNAQLYGRYR